MIGLSEAEQLGMVPHSVVVGRQFGEGMMDELSWTSGASVAAGMGYCSSEVLEQKLYDVGAVLGTAVGKGFVDRNDVGVEVTREVGSRQVNLPGKSPKGSGWEVDGLRRDGQKEEEEEEQNHLDCSCWDTVVEEVVWERECGKGRGMRVGEKRPGCLASLPSVCTCNIKNRVISNT